MKKITKIVAPALLVLVGLGIDNVNRVNALGDIGPADPATTLTSTTYRPDSLGEMKLSSQKVYELDDNLNRLSYKSYCYSSEEGKLLPDYKKDSTFDSKNRVTSETEYLYDGEVESCWRRSTYQYDGKYNYTIMGESYDSSKSAFVPNFKNVFTYDDNGFLTNFKDYGYYDQGYVIQLENVFTSLTMV